MSEIGEKIRWTMGRPLRWEEGGKGEKLEIGDLRSEVGGRRSER